MARFPSLVRGFGHRGRDLRASCEQRGKFTADIVGTELLVVHNGKALGVCVGGSIIGRGGDR